MPRFAANLTMMFAELPVAERFAAARAAGFSAVEFLSPYAHPIDEVDDWLRSNELQLILLNTSVGDGAAGERGLAGVPGREEEFGEHFDAALRYATALGAGMIHVMAGLVEEKGAGKGAGAAAADDAASNAALARAERTLIANLQTVAPRAAAAGVVLLLEPLNTQDVPGYLHTRADHTASLLARIDQPNVKMQFDLYHQQIMGGNLLAQMQRHWPMIGHIQFSSVPGRHEPQHGEVNLPFLFDAIDQLGYDGWIGCEYRAKTSTLEGLSWYERYRPLSS